MKLIITGGAGFIGSAVVRRALSVEGWSVLNLDKLTYAGNLESLASVSANPRYEFRRIDICDSEAVASAFRDFRPNAVLHLAAESHVDRSIDGPAAFVQTNVVGTAIMLEEARRYYEHLSPDAQRSFRFHHVSTDEVFGSLGPNGLFTESSHYAPNSPYSATKAASDHLVRAWSHTYKFPTLVTNCSNNYGPYQFPEKFIPLVILNSLEDKPIPVYGKGDNVRDWLHVDDHAEALLAVLQHGQCGETYNIGGASERQNIEVVHEICDLLDELVPTVKPRRGLITYVKDRPGHDFRYAIDSTKIRTELAWRPRHTFSSGLKQTIEWYVANRDGWCRRTRDGSYRGERLGLGSSASC